jgi:hypothetical protein
MFKFIFSLISLLLISSPECIDVLKSEQKVSSVPLQRKNNYYAGEDEMLLVMKINEAMVYSLVWLVQ